MKKNLVSLVSLALLAGLVSMTSCKKENTLGNGTQFHATMEGCTMQNGKTTLNGTALEWVSGDQIAVYGTAGCGIYTATPQNPTTVAEFDNVSGETGNAPFRAFYPASLTTDGVNITLPSTQTYVDGSINEFPMYAESSNEELSFKNLCGALKLHLTKANTSISTITITTANEINGTFSVNYNGGAPELEHVSGGTNTATLTCTIPQSIAEGKYFYIYLPEGSYTGLQIEMNTNDNRYCVKTANTAIVVNRSRYTPITLGANDLDFVEPLPQGALPGLFTINANGDQVRFSQGNLQYQASTDTWRFATNQYDYVGGTIVNGVMMGNVYENGVLCNNELVSPTYSGWIDLFEWGTGNNPTLRVPVEVARVWSFVDWGTNAISNGGNEADIWRTPTSEEWCYILHERTNHDNLLAPATINGVPGIVLLPDNWELPTGCHFNVPTSADYYVNGSTHILTANYSLNTYSLTDWAVMDSAGAVFLEAASTTRDHGSSDLFYNHTGWIDYIPFGYYWSSSNQYSYTWGEGWSTSTWHSYVVAINDYICAGKSGYPSISATQHSSFYQRIDKGCSVRLIQDVD